MLRKPTFYLLIWMLVWPAALIWSAQAPAQQKQAKDQQEADLINSAFKETNPTKKLAILDEWKQKYPDTAFKVERLQSYIQAYQQANQLAKAVDTARELLTIAPADLLANITLASLIPFLGSSDQKLWADAEHAANALLAGKVDKPANVSDADWAAAQKQVQFPALQALGWVAMQQKKNDVAEQQFLKTLDLNPGAAQVSYWLGLVVVAQKNPDKNVLALFSFARAVSYNGPGALPPDFRQKVDSFLTNQYKNYHGDQSGLAELKALAAKQPLPPPDLKIKSSAEVQAEKEEELKKTNPLLATWLAIKENLTGADSAKFWGEMKGKALPELQGTVVSAKPAVKPKVVEIGITAPGTAEVTLTAPETPARCKLDPGAVIKFKDVEAKDFTANPFMLKLEGGTITSGCAVAPAPAKKAPAKAGKKASKK